MDNVIFSHFYASTSFLVTNLSYAFYHGNSMMSMKGWSYGTVAYIATLGWLCYRDPKLQTSWKLVVQILINKATEKWNGPSKNRNKPVRKLRRPNKKKGLTPEDLQKKLMEPIVLMEEDL